MLSTSQAVKSLRMADLLDGYQLGLLVEALDGLMAAGGYRLQAHELPAALSAWVDQHLHTEQGRGELDAAELRYRARMFAAVAASFPDGLEVVCERVWVWRRTAGRHTPETLPASGSFTTFAKPASYARSAGSRRLGGSDV